MVDLITLFLHLFDDIFIRTLNDDGNHLMLNGLETFISRNAFQIVVIYQKRNGSDSSHNNHNYKSRQMYVSESDAFNEKHRFDAPFFITTFFPRMKTIAGCRVDKIVSYKYKYNCGVILCSLNSQVSIFTTLFLFFEIHYCYCLIICSLL